MIVRYHNILISGGREPQYVISKHHASPPLATAVIERVRAGCGRGRAWLATFQSPANTSQRVGPRCRLAPCRPGLRVTDQGRFAGSTGALRK